MTARAVKEVVDLFSVVTREFLLTLTDNEEEYNAGTKFISTLVAMWAVRAVDKEELQELKALIEDGIDEQERERESDYKEEK